jgi:hypothetical protein
LASRLTQRRWVRALERAFICKALYSARGP